MATLIKIDRNGSKHYEGWMTCDRCSGRGLYATGTVNGQLRITPVDGGICHKCLGKGKVFGKWIERTPEYEAKLMAKRQERAEEQQRKYEEEHAEEIRQREEAQRKAEEERRAEEERIRAEKANSRYVGQEGQKITLDCIYKGSPYFECKSPFGYDTERIYIHNFRDSEGNAIIWKTGKGLALEKEDRIELTGTVKEHKEYKDEKQTYLLRCKIVKK